MKPRDYVRRGLTRDDMRATLLHLYAEIRRYERAQPWLVDDGLRHAMDNARAVLRAEGLIGGVKIHG